MSDLVAFLLARIEEDEEDARAVLGEWVTDEDWVACFIPYEGISLWSNGPADAAEADRATPHITRWNTARVLAECEAKRQIIAVHPSSGDDYETLYCRTCHWDVDCDSPRMEHQDGYGVYPGNTLRALALPYAGHPDYDPAWRPA